MRGILGAWTVAHMSYAVDPADIPEANADVVLRQCLKISEAGLILSVASM